MLLPKKTKYRKVRKGKNEGNATRGHYVAFGDYGLQSQGNNDITSRQIESARQAMTRYIKRGGQIWIRIFRDKPMTKKAAEVPMGKGKGDLDHYVFEVHPGRILFEVQGVSEEVAREAFRKACAKLPLQGKLVGREETTA